MEVVRGLVQILLPKLGELLKKEYGLQTGVREKIRSVSLELGILHGVLCEISDVPPDQIDKPVKLWVRDLTEASYDMEDIVDEFLVRIDDTDEPTDPHMLKRLRKKVSKLFKHVWARRNISTQIQDIAKKLEELAARRARYKLDSGVAKSAAATTIDPRLHNLYKTVSELVGVDGPKDELISMLSIRGDDDGSVKKTKIVSLVGFGGLGKTTLAKAVYDHFKPYFECTAFVLVGQKPDVKRVLVHILIGLGKGKYMNSNMDVLEISQLMEDLKEFVKEKRSFIVIDDIWDEDSWKLIRCALGESNCTRVVITTRISEVARHASEVYKMKKLSRENSKKLLHARIGDEGKYFVGPLSEACDKILKKCGGVPLAIITIASLLANKPEQYWDDVYNSIGFGQEDNDDVHNTRRILSFSYYDLPSHLKPCLLYLSVFPEDHVIYKNSLIWMWIAEGLVHEEQAAREGLFELGEMYYNELINRNMIQEEELEYDGYVQGCRVHDMVLDLICSLSGEQNFVTVLDGDERRRLPGSIIPRRLALQHVARHNDGSQVANINVEKVRSLIVSQVELGSACLRIPFLRVLDMVSCEGLENVEGMLDHLGSLLHLRYLRLQRIPRLLLKQVRYLKCLQTLDLLQCGMDELPEEVGLLAQLVCLRVSFETMVPAGLISRLPLLQQLWMWGHAANVMQFVKELGMLRELRVLWIGIDVTSKRMERALLESLGNLHKIRTMNIYGAASADNNGETSDVGFISGRHLQNLHLRCIVFPRVPASLAPNLCYLHMEVRDVKEQDMEGLARLPELCCLELQVHSPDAELVSIIKIPRGAGYFRKLRILKITGPSIWFDLHASECSSSRVASNIMPSLESLEFVVHVQSLKDATWLGFHGMLLGFQNLGTTSLQRVSVDVNCTHARISKVEEVGAALVHAGGIHPKHPTFKTYWKNETKMLSPYQEVASTDNTLYKPTINHRVLACMDMNGTHQSLITKARKLANVIDSGQIRALRMPDPAACSSKVICLQYTNDGMSLLALSSNAVHKLWKWERCDRNPLSKATTSVPPQLWQPGNSIVMTNDTTDINTEEATACNALSEDGNFLISASGAKITMFNMDTFQIITTFMAPPPAATFLAFYPQDYNTIAIGMDDSSIQIYDIDISKVKIKTVLKGGHTEKITGLAFSQSMDVLVSSGADGQLCVWSIDGWEKKESRYIQPPSNQSGPLVGDTMVQFHYDQTHLLVVHESQVAIYDGKLIKLLCSWFPRDALPAPVSSAVYSSDGLSVYAGFRDGAIGIFEVESLRLQCRIAPSAYIPSSISSTDDGIVYPIVVAANPWKPYQIAVGMSDGAVHMLEPLDTGVKVGVGASGEHPLGRTSSGNDDSQLNV